MKKLNKRGFSHVEMFILVLVIGVIGAVGFVTYSRSKDRSSKADLSDSQSSTPVDVKLEEDNAPEAVKSALKAKIDTEVALEKAGKAVLDGKRCEGTKGSSGPRVEILYVTKDADSNYKQDSDRLRTVAAGVNSIFNESAAKTGGKSKVRWQRDADCQITVRKVVVNNPRFYSDYDNNVPFVVTKLSDTIKEKGYKSADRKYLIFMNRYNRGGCGRTSGTIQDSRPGPENKNNKRDYIFLDRSCWKNDPPVIPVSVTTSFLARSLGAEQWAAPNSWKCNLISTGEEIHTGNFTDAYGVFSIKSNSANSTPDRTNCTEMVVKCDISQLFLLDCNNDDYFANPETLSKNSYLAKHWNVYNSRFLSQPGK